MNLYKQLRYQNTNSAGKPMGIIQLSKLLGISPACISKIERNIAIPTLEVIVAYQKYFGVSCDTLIHSTLTRFSYSSGKK